MAAILPSSLNSSIAALGENTFANVTRSATSTLSLSTAWRYLLVPFHAIAQLERFAFVTAPRTFLQWIGLLDAPIAEAIPMAGAAVAEVGQAATLSWTDLFSELFQASTNKSYWGMLHYITSRWSFVCLFMALVMNRIGVYGSSRQRVFLSWNKRLALRLIPIMLLIAQIHQLLRAIHCQSSPNFSLYRHGDNDMYTVLDWSTDGGVFHKMSSTLLFWESDADSCAAIDMSRPKPGVKAKKGSFSLLWPAFLRLSASHIVESLSSSLQQTPLMTEVGISVFEHSIAFAEAETTIAHTLNQNAPKTQQNSTITSEARSNYSEATVPASRPILALTDALHAMAGPHPFNRFNVPMEALLIALLSCANALSANIISVLGKQRQLRLINTAFWGLLYMSSFTWGFIADSTMVRLDGAYPRSVSAILHFPTVAIVGFLPHMLIVFGIFVCGIIYMVALLLTAVSLGASPELPRPSSLKERFAIAHGNLQASIQFKTINIRWYEDFYTFLLRVGFAALTAASEAVFLNEGRSVEMRQFTWLEEDRLDELEASDTFPRAEGEAGFQIVEERGLPGPISSTGEREIGEWRSGYDKERKVEKKDSKSLQNGNQFIYPNPRVDGVGFLQRTTRFYLLFIFLRGVMFTIAGWAAYAVGLFLDRVGITARPAWLRRIAGSSLKQAEINKTQVENEGQPSLEFWSVSNEGRLVAPPKSDFDIERKMSEQAMVEDPDHARSLLDEKMYNWWKIGGWYGTSDESGEYQPSLSERTDWDNTSVVTTTTDASSSADRNSGSESDSDGRRTPTQKSTWSFSRIRESSSPSPESDLLDTSNLARLLNPQDKAARDEARILSSHLTSTGPVTRARFRQQLENNQNRLFMAGYSSALAPGTTVTSTKRPLTHEEEVDVLEQLLITRRQQKRRRDEPHTGTEAVDNSASFVANGPSCVVCQAEPRTIITWPCRCLTVCEDCRVNLAMNNFGNCVTCRRSVSGFVRLYVP